MNILFLVGLILLFAFSSCKKDNLEGDSSILEGKWEWVYSVKRTNVINPFNAWVDTIIQEQATYELEFLSKGRFHLIEKGEIIEKHRVVLRSFDSGSSMCSGGFLNPEIYRYIIYPDNDENNIFEGCVTSDSLTCFSRNFPFSFSDDGNTSIIYENFYKKVN
ncbi:MAG: hypothetical protein P8P74_13370 [Crocinitomicaceae bacterium]|nr:hypothetical protein [Crocinitomicaceae bacterium]